MLSTDTDGMSDFPAAGVVLKDLTATQASLRKDAAPLPPSTSLSPKSSIYNMSSSSVQRDLLLHDLRQNDLKASLIGDLKTNDEFRFGKSSNKDMFDSLESIVRIKEAEARMFQNRADEAQREAERYRRVVHAKTEKLEEEYTEKLAKLCLQETEERRRKKLEELKVLENSHCDYYNMKMRMQAEIAGLLERMEATKQQWV